ncbi:hypothetical protein X797_005295 [Metarhizium robertsii]|uniref:Uncharacterized protein n=1 Tax=Metarhizium robertsii TaxID=568076 RepID=A0A0A1UV89_9HYPO|nr:hypothetical protein X797_005295 [Metarhizium robertsii]
MDPNGDKVDGKALPWTEEAKEFVHHRDACGGVVFRDIGASCRDFGLGLHLRLTGIQFQFLIRIVAQLRENGRSINWQKIDMPGRTVKSMQNMWTKINKMIAEVETESGDAPIKRPSQLSGLETLSLVAGLPWRIGNLMTDKPAARKRTPRKGQSVAASEDDDERSTPAKSPRKAVPQKRASTGRGGSAKKLKRGADDIDDEDDMVFKPEPEVDLRGENGCFTRG